MNTQQIITTIAFWVALFWISYWMVAQDRAKASEEYLALVQEKQQLEQEIKEESDSWWVDEYAKQECIDSWSKKQDDRSKQNDKRRTRIEQIDQEMGLIESSQAPKKISQNESGFITNDTDGTTTDNKWYKKLLKWVGLTW